MLPKGTARADFRSAAPETVQIETRIGAGRLTASQAPTALYPNHPTYSGSRDTRSPAGAQRSEARPRPAVPDPGGVALLVGAIGIANAPLCRSSSASASSGSAVPSASGGDGTCRRPARRHLTGADSRNRARWPASRGPAPFPSDERRRVFSVRSGDTEEYGPAAFEPHEVFRSQQNHRPVQNSVIPALHERSGWPAGAPHRWSPLDPFDGGRRTGYREVGS